MKSSLETLGVPRELVEHERSTGSLRGVLELAESLFKAFAKRYHPDINPAAVDLYTEVSMAIEDIRDPVGLELAVSLYLDQSDRNVRLRREEAGKERARVIKSLASTLELLQNVNQFDVLNIDKPTTYLLQPGSARVILDVNDSSTAEMALSAAETDVLTGESEQPLYQDDFWSELYVRDGKLTSYIHMMLIRPEHVRVVGFLPESAFRVKDHQDDIVRGDLAVSQVDDTLRTLSALDWVLPAEAWFIPYLSRENEPGSELVVLNAQGFMARVGSIRASADL